MNAYPDDIHLLTGAYAVDALDELERARFEAHLDVCPDCRVEVAGLTEAAGLLSETTAQEPRPELRDLVLAGIATVRPLPPVVVSHQRVPRGVSRRAPRRWFPLVAVAAALALILGVGVGVVWQPWNDDPDTSQVQLTAAERVLGAPDAQTVSLDIAGGGRAKVVRSKSEGRAVLVATDMPPAPDGKVYELWLRGPKGHLSPAGLMPNEPDQTILLDGDASGATGVGVTVEPAGGSDVPTSSPIAMFELA
jgi:anti-sigma-K factor RskA